MGQPEVKPVKTLLPLLLLLEVGCGAAQTAAPVTAAAKVDDSQSAEQEFAKAQAHLRAGDLTRAEQYLAAARSRGYPEAQVVPALIDVCVRGSRLRGALAHAEPYLKRHPDDIGLRFLVATLELALGHPALSHSQLERTVQRDPKYAPAHYLLGVLRRDVFSDLSGAQAAFASYLELEPHGEHAVEARGWLSEWREAVAPVQAQAATAPVAEVAL